MCDAGVVAACRPGRLYVKQGINLHRSCMAQVSDTLHAATRKSNDSPDVFVLFPITWKKQARYVWGYHIIQFCRLMTSTATAKPSFTSAMADASQTGYTCHSFGYASSVACQHPYRAQRTSRSRPYPARPTHGSLFCTDCAATPGWHGYAPRFV